MSSGRLKVVLGPMFSGKSSTLVRRADQLLRSGYDHRLFKPSFDNRYSETEVVTHDGVSLPCLSIGGPTDVPKSVEIVLLDEVQFFGIELIPWVRELLDRGIDVLAVGLDMDWRGEPFVVLGSLAAMADEVEKLHAQCSVCGAEASKTAKVGGDATDIIELGSSDKYEPRCNGCWRL